MKYIEQEPNPISDLIGELTDMEGVLISQAFAAIGLTNEQSQAFAREFGRRWGREIQPWLSRELFFWPAKVQG